MQNSKVNSQVVKTFLDLGFSIIPMNQENIPWDRYTEKIMNWGVYQTKFISNNGHFKDAWGVAIVCGKISGNLECLDIDCKHDIDGGNLWAEFKSLLDEQIPDVQFVIERTKNNGYHVFYRCEELSGEQVILARNKNRQTIIERIGEGHLVTVCPSPGYKIQQGKFGNIPYISPEKRKTLLDIAASFNQFVDKKDYVKPAKKEFIVTLGKSPFDDYNDRGDIVPILEKHGWTFRYKKGEKLFFRRPQSKTKTVHATYNHIPNCFYSFSSNCAPFEPLKAYNNSAVFCTLECDGNWKDAYKKILEMGYGEKPEKKNVNKKDSAKISPKIVIDEPKEITKKPVFPIEVFPPDYQEIIEKISAQFGFPKDVFAVSIMCAVSTGIGLSHYAELENGWKQYPIIYAALVGTSASGKSPAMEWAFKPYEEIEESYEKEYNYKLAQFNKYQELDKKTRNQLKDSFEITEQPVRREVLIKDATLEALLFSHKSNKKGLLVYVDELAQWFKRFNSYRKGADVEQWLSIFDGKGAKINRMTRVDSLSKAFVTVCGGIQPSMLKELGSDGLDKNGFLFRFLFVFAQEGAYQTWEEMKKSKAESHLPAKYKEIINRFLESSEFAYTGESTAVKVSQKADKVWGEFFDKNAKNMEKWRECGEYEKISISTKLSQYTTRFALILQMMDYSVGMDEKEEISEISMTGAIKLVEYFRDTFEMAMDEIKNGREEALENKVYEQSTIERSKRNKLEDVDWSIIFGESDQLQRKDIVDRVKKYFSPSLVATRTIDDGIRKFLTEGSKYGMYKIKINE